MKTLAEQFESFCNTTQLTAQQLDEETYRLGIETEKGKFDSYCDIYEDRRLLVFRTIYPVKFQQSDFLRFTELTTSINSKLAVGCYELSKKTGTIAFKTSVLLGPNDFDSEILEHLIFGNWSIMTKFFPIFTLMACSPVTPDEAVKLLEKGENSKKKTASQVDLTHLANRRLGDISNN